MSKISLQKIKKGDKKYFVKWWRDKSLIRLTSGILKRISDQEVEKYFSAMLKNRTDYHFMIVLGQKAIGHISLTKRKLDWYETQIVIGKKKYRSKGYGTKAIKLLIKKAQRLGIYKIYLEVRPDNIRAIRAYDKCGFRRKNIRKYPYNKYLTKILRMELKN